MIPKIFKPEQFSHVWIHTDVVAWLDGITNQANELFAKWIEENSTVVDGPSKVLIIRFEPIEKKCEHEHIHSYNEQSTFKNISFKCYKCKKEMKPIGGWAEVSE